MGFIFVHTALLFVVRILSISVIQFGLVWFYGISNIEGYSMPNPFLYTKTVLFQTIQFSTSTQFRSIRTRVDPGAMGMKGYSAFHKAPVLLKPLHLIV